MSGYGFVMRLMVWSAELALHLSLAILRPLLTIVEELFAIALRVVGRLLVYPESWVIIAVATLWFMAGRGLVATVVGMAAVAGLAVRWLLQERSL